MHATVAWPEGLAPVECHTRGCCRSLAPFHGVFSNPRLPIRTQWHACWHNHRLVISTFGKSPPVGAHDYWVYFFQRRDCANWISIVYSCEGPCRYIFRRHTPSPLSPYRPHYVGLRSIFTDSVKPVLGTKTVFMLATYRVVLAENVVHSCGRCHRRALTTLQVSSPLKVCV